MMGKNAQSEDEKLFSGTVRLNARILGLVLGLLLGLTLFLMTNWLVLKAHIAPSGEYTVGPHLQLLNQFFIGYRVSFLGSLIGFAYGFAVGTLIGALIGWIYDKIVDFRDY